MILDRETVGWLSPEGKEVIRQKIILGLRKQLRDYWDDSDEEFKECCETWQQTLLLKPDSLARVCEDMNNQAGDMFGTEGWEKGLGLPT
jgi:hypothetical protein